MASDQQVLAALAAKTSQDMRYFELVRVACGTLKRKCYVCLGKHAMIFVRSDLNGMIHKGGELMYAYINKVVQDKQTSQHLLLLLSENKPGEWESTRLFVQIDNRELFLKHLRCNWQTDRMWRMGRVEPFPKFEYEITTKVAVTFLAAEQAQDSQPAVPDVEPFRGYKWCTYQGYRFMIPAAFSDQANAIQVEQTGEYKNEGTGVTLIVHVHENLTLDQLEKLNRDHIRWVAAAYKVQLVKEESQFYVLKDAMRPKRMNLSGDVAAWHGWEITIRTREATLLCLLLRRQYVPPVCDSAQDIALMIRCPAEEWRRSELQVRLEAYLCMDSFGPAASSNEVYHDIVQAKLDALRFDEAGLEWIGSHLKLQSMLRTEAKKFLRCIIKLFLVPGQEEGVAGVHRSILNDASVLVENDDDEEWADLPEFNISMLDRMDQFSFSMLGLPRQEKEDTEAAQIVRNKFIARMGRYFCWAVDGGLLGPRFTLDTMVEGLGQVGEQEYSLATTLFNFMLHMRSKDFHKAYELMPLMQQIIGIKDCIFNDRAMTVVLSTEWLRKQFGRVRDVEYFQVLGKLLQSSAGINLKAYVCRVFMEARQESKGGSAETYASMAALEGLLYTMKTGPLYLQTYASAALVNLSHGNDAIKTKLMGAGIAKLAIENIKTKDDDLINYTLTLMVNLTKEPHHRVVLVDEGVLPLLYDMLTSSYQQCLKPKNAGPDATGSAMMANSMKDKLLTQLCSVVGHFCKDEAYREHFLEMYPHTIKCMVYIATHCVPGSVLMSKVMFSLKQLCANAFDKKEWCGTVVIKPLIKFLRDLSIQDRDDVEKGLDFTDVERNPEFIYHAMLLLQMLATLSDNCSIIEEAAVRALDGAPVTNGRLAIEVVFEDVGKLPITKRFDRYALVVDELVVEIKRVQATFAM